MTKKIVKTGNHDIRELRKKHEELNAEKAELLRKRKNVLTKKDNNENAMATHIARAKQLENDLRQAEKKELRGDISEEDLHGIKKSFENSVAAFEKAEKMRHLSGQVINELDHEIRQIDDRIKIVLRKICTGIREDLESKLKPDEIREKLVEIYTSRMLTDAGGTEWFRLIMAYFPAPDTPEVKASKEKFIADNKL